MAGHADLTQVFSPRLTSGSPTARGVSWRTNAKAEELERFEDVRALSAFLPIRTIALKTAIAVRLVESSGWLCEICPGEPRGERGAG